MKTDLLFLIVPLLCLLWVIQMPNQNQVVCKVVEANEKVTTLRCEKSLTNQPTPVYYDFPQDEYEFTGCTEVTLERVDGKTRIADKQASGCRIVKRCLPDENGYVRRPANVTPCD